MTEKQLEFEDLLVRKAMEARVKEDPPTPQGSRFLQVLKKWSRRSVSVRVSENDRRS